MKLATSILILLSMAILTGAARAQDAYRNGDPKTLIALYDLQDLVFNEMGGNKEAATKIQLWLTRKDPEQRLRQLDDKTIETLSSNYSGWHDSRKVDALTRFLDSIREVQNRYGKDFKGTLTEFSNEWSSISAASGGDQLTVQASADAHWISDNLGGVPIVGLKPEARGAFTELYSLLGDYKFTGDSRLLRMMADDLRIKRDHCEVTHSRADETTDFTFDTIDESNQKQPNWVVFAVSLRGEIQRIGDPSTPVKGRLIPGRWLFFATHGADQSLGELHIVSKGSIDPPSILIRLRK